MKIAIVRNTQNAQVIQRFGMQNKEFYKEEDIDAVKNVLESAGHDVSIVEGDTTLISTLKRLKHGENNPDDFMVFNLAYGVQGQCRYTHIPSILELSGIPYVGSGPKAHTICLDKNLAKIVLKNAGLPTPEFQLFSSENDTLDSHLAFPLIVKPQSESTSFGIKVVKNNEQLKEAILYILTEFNQPALVEQYIDGMEVNCGIMGNNPPKPLPVLEIDFGKRKGTERVFIFETKRDRLAEHIVPARISDELAERVQILTVAAFKALGCNDCARVDFRIDKEGNPYILELNSMAAIHRNGSYFDAAQSIGIDYDKMINNILEAAVKRYFG